MTVSIADATREHLGSFSPAERKVGRALLADYPRAGLRTTASLAKAAGVSPPTVVRFATSLGCNGFADLQLRLRDEIAVAAQARTPRVDRTATSTTSPVAAAAEQLADSVVDTARAQHHSEWEAALAALCDLNREVLCVGGRFTGTMAELFAAALNTVRPATHYLRDPLGTDASLLVDLDTRCTLMAFDVATYQSSTIEVVSYARSRKATTILVTDHSLSPAAADSDVVLTVPSWSASPFGGITSTAVVVELLLRDAVSRLADSGRDRLRRLDQLRGQELVTPTR